MSLFSTPVLAHVPQLYGTDLLVRMSPSQLHGIVFEHLSTTQEAEVLADAFGEGVGAIVGGTTEWQGQYGGKILSLAWDWFMTPEGTIELLTSVGPRSNICLLDPKGYDMPSGDLCHSLFDFIRAFQWRCRLADALHRSRVWLPH